MSSNFVLKNRPEIDFLNPSGTSLKGCFSRPSINIQRHLFNSELISIQSLAHWMTMNRILSAKNAQQFTFESLQYIKHIWAVTAFWSRQWVARSIHSAYKIISFNKQLNETQGQRFRPRKTSDISSLHPCRTENTYEHWQYFEAAFLAALTSFFSTFSDVDVSGLYAQLLSFSAALSLSVGRLYCGQSLILHEHCIVSQLCNAVYSCMMSHVYSRLDFIDYIKIRNSNNSPLSKRSLEQICSWNVDILIFW